MNDTKDTRYWISSVCSRWNANARRQLANGENLSTEEIQSKGPWSALLLLHSSPKVELVVPACLTRESTFLACVQWHVATMTS